MKKFFTRAAAMATIVTTTMLMASQADAGLITLDFEDQAITNNVVNLISDTLQEDGFTITAPNQMAIAGTLSSRYAGDTALLNPTQSIMTIGADNGDLFDLKSLTLSEINLSQSAFVTVTGVFANDTTIQTLLVTDGVGITPETYLEGVDFSGFENLKRLEIFNSNPGHQVNEMTMNVIPEPGTIALFSGVGLMTFFVRRFFLI